MLEFLRHMDNVGKVISLCEKSALRLSEKSYEYRYWVAKYEEAVFLHTEMEYFLLTGE